MSKVPPPAVPPWQGPDPLDPTTSTARMLRLVALERERQIKVERFNDVHDDRYIYGELARAAACYTLANIEEMDPYSFNSLWRSVWPFDKKWWKPGDSLRNLAKAGALILAEMERIERVLEDQQQA